MSRNWWIVAGISALVIAVPAMMIAPVPFYWITPEAFAYETYHDPSWNEEPEIDPGRCATCHPTFTNRDDLHDLHQPPLTGTCNLCHTGSGRNNPFTMWSTGTGDPNTNYGCTGCHGREYGENIALPNGYDNGSGTFDLNGLAKMSGWGLRQQHADQGITECAGCHTDGAPWDEGPESNPATQPPYYQSAGGTFTNITGTCNTDGSEDSSPEPSGEDTLGLDNDGDGLIDGNDPDCQDPVCGDGTVDPGEDCDDGNTDPGDCCADDCTYEPTGSTCGDPSDSDCDNPDSCDGAGTCDANLEAPGFACGDQGVECLVDDTCDGTGTCTDNGFEGAGTACGSSEDTDCDNPDSCDASGTCQDNLEAPGFACGDPSDTDCDNPDSCDGAGTCDANLEAPGFACGDQGVECLVDDTCNGTGTCTDNGFEGAGTACGSPEDTDCDNPDSCDGAGTCQDNFESPGFACGDQGVECLVDDTCNGAGACTDNGAEPDDTPCGDPSSDQCNAADSCQSGLCDSNFVAGGTACDDNLFCNIGETCTGDGACAGGSARDCGDPVGCTDDSCDEGSDACVNTANDANCPDDGQFCTGTEFCDAALDCQSTGDPCDPGTETCNEGTDTCDALGVCGNGAVEEGEDCDGGECCDEFCNYATAGTACGDQGFECLVDDACDGAGACTDNGAEGDGTPCGSASDTECSNPDSCQAGVCDPGDEALGFACGDQGIECLADDACDGAGACTDNGASPDGTACGNPATSECDGADSCIAGACDPNLATAGAPCGDQGVDCRVDDTCDGAGACTDNGAEGDGTPCGSAADTECSNPDSCLAGVCDANDEAEGFACGDQGVECLVDDACDGGGGCFDNGVAGAGTACGSPADTECDNPDTCDAGGTCQPNNEPSGFACGDQGIDCQVDDTCDGGGVCTDNGTAPDGTACGDPSSDQCDAEDVCAAGVCDPNYVSAGTACDDGAFCNVGETCTGDGACAGGSARDCGDSVGCTEDSCDEVGDACVNAANDANCPDDALFCNGTEFCDPALDCQSTGDPCDPGTETCNEATDTCDPGVAECGNGTVEEGEDCDGGDCCDVDCTFAAAGTVCGNQTACHADDTCDAVGVCVDNGFLPDGTACRDQRDTDCDNPNNCQAGVCEPNHEPAGTTCDDGLFCNVNEACDGDGLCGGGSLNACDDGVDCTDDSCDEAGDLCVNTANDANCPDDGEFCTGNEFCNATLDCQSTGDPCDPATEACNETTDACDSTNLCGNGTVDAGEDCDGGECCAADCTYEVSGTTCGDPEDTDCDNPDTCDGAGACQPNYEASGLVCGTQGACLEDDTCDGAGTCDDNGLVPDGTACRDQRDTACDNPDSCLGGVCEANQEPAGTGCDDGLFCNVNEACDGDGFCAGGSPNACDDGVGCTDDSCDEAGDACVNAANDANCPDDGFFCNGTEFCDPALDCSSTGDPCDPATEACNEETDICDSTVLCGNGVPDPGEDCDGGECCAADCTYEVSGTTCGDPEDTDCDNPDTCDGAGACQPNYEASGFICGTQGACLEDDTCDGAGTCDDNGVLPDGTACRDQRDTECDNPDNCQAGVCEPNHEPAGAACEDDQFCTSDSTCDGDGLCAGGLPRDCGDGVACTDDSCNEQANACVNLPNDTNCSGDGQFCNGVEFCDPVADCSSPGDPCDPVTETCNETTDSCDIVPGICGNGVAEEGEDCDGGECCEADCTFTVVGTACDDGLFCNIEETCDGAGLCTGGSPNACDDGVGCTDDSCEEGSGACVNAANDLNCPSDGLFCNGAEFCDSVADCSSPGEPCDPVTEVCNETTDVCDPVGELCGNGALDAGEQCDGTPCCRTNCTYSLAGTACGDGSDTECDNPDTCDGGGTCQPNYEASSFVCGTQTACHEDDTCDGGGACTDNGLKPDGTACRDQRDTVCDNPDSCLAGVCEPNNELPGTPCDDGLFCNVGEACNGGFCTGGTSPCDPVTESCSEAADTCDALTPGEVSDPLSAPQMIVTGYDKGTDTISISYSAACLATDNTIEYGDLSQVGTYTYAGQECNIGNAGTYDWASPANPGSLFFLVVANDGSLEGSYGRRSSGPERPDDTTSLQCPLPQGGNACN